GRLAMDHPGVGRRPLSRRRRSAGGRRESKGSEVASEPGGVEPNAAEGRHEKAGYGRVVVADHREFARYTQALADRGAQDECGGVVVEGSDAGDPGSAPLAHDETRGRLLDNGVLEPHPRIRT